MSESVSTDLCRDESRFSGYCERAIKASSRADIAKALAADGPVTAQGARTGIAGAAVPLAGAALELGDHKGITDIYKDEKGFVVGVRAGTTLSELRSALARRDIPAQNLSESAAAALDELKSAGAQIFGPDPTEDTATVGGMFATNAGGPRSLLYGRTGASVEAADMLLSDGAALHIKRGENAFSADGRCALPDGRTLAVALPAVCADIPLLPRPGEDLIDLLAGSEGMLGVFDTLWLRLAPQPAVRWSLAFFLPGCGDAARFADAALAAAEPWNARLASLEYLDENSLALFSALRENQPRLRPIPELPAGAGCAVTAELHADDDAQAEEALGELLGVFADCGGSDDATWAADSEEEAQRFRLLRHAVPEAVNAAVDERRASCGAITKLAADVSQPGASLAEFLPALTERLASSGIPYALFGHLGARHMHANLICRDAGEYAEGRALALSLARECLERGGSPAAENGVGKLKRELLAELLPPDSLEAMKAVKRFFDPEGRLNPGNMFEG